eukprot:s636_g23.t1
MVQRDWWNGLPLKDPQKPSALHARGTVDIGRTDESKFDVEMKRQRKRLLNAFLLQDWALALAVLSHLAAGDSTHNTLDISIYDRSIGACRSAGNWQLANFFLISMHRQRTFPDAVCCSNAMSTCSKELQWRAATAMLEQMFIQSVVPDLVCLGAVLGTLPSTEDLPVWTNALAILQQHPATSRSNICCNACISSCVQWSTALNFLHGMAAAAARRDGISISTTIASAEDRRYWQLALSLSPWHLGPDLAHATNACNALSSALEKSGQWQRSLQILLSMIPRQIRPDPMTCNSVISACEKVAVWDMALDLLPRAQHDIYSFSAVASSCVNVAEGRKWRRALYVVSSMEENRVKASSITLSTAVVACELGRFWQGAVGMLSKTSPRISPDLVLQNAAIRGVGSAASWRNALQLLSSSGFQDALSFQGALEVCERAGHESQAPALLEGVAQLSETQLFRRSEKKSTEALLIFCESWEISAHQDSSRAIISAISNMPSVRRRRVQGQVFGHHWTVSQRSWGNPSNPWLLQLFQLQAQKLFKQFQAESDAQKLAAPVQAKQVFPASSQPRKVAKVKAKRTHARGRIGRLYRSPSGLSGHSSDTTFSPGPEESLPPPTIKKAPRKRKPTSQANPNLKKYKNVAAPMQVIPQPNLIRNAARPFWDLTNQNAQAPHQRDVPAPAAPAARAAPAAAVAAVPAVPAVPAAPAWMGGPVAETSRSRSGSAFVRSMQKSQVLSRKSRFETALNGADTKEIEDALADLKEEPSYLEDKERADRRIQEEHLSRKLERATQGGLVNYANLISQWKKPEERRSLERVMQSRAKQQVTTLD